MSTADIVLPCLTFGCCIFLIGFFSKIETALSESRKSRLEHLFSDGDVRAGSALKFLDDPGTLVAASQICIAFLSIILGAVSGTEASSLISSAFPGLSHSKIFSIGFIIVIVTYFVLLFGEFLPKQISLQDPETVLLNNVNVLSAIDFVAKPFVRFLSSSAYAVMLLFGVNPNVDDSVTEDEVKDLIEQGTEEGTFEKAEQDMVDRIFRMSDQTAYSVMTPRLKMEWIDISDAVEYNLRRIQKSSGTVFPVGNGNLDNFLGIVYAKDLLNASLEQKKIDLSSFIKKPLFIPRAMETFRVLEKFRESKVHEAVVLDEYGGVIGFITLGDIVEEIIGDVEQDSEADSLRITQRSENSWYVDGLCSVGDFKEKFDISDLPNEAKDHYQTVGGFLTSYFGYIPQVGEKCTWNEFTFEILRLDRARIAKLMVKRPT